MQQYLYVGIHIENAHFMTNNSPTNGGVSSFRVSRIGCKLNCMICSLKVILGQYWLGNINYMFPQFHSFIGSKCLKIHSFSLKSLLHTCEPLVCESHWWLVIHDLGKVSSNVGNWTHYYKFGKKMLVVYLKRG